MDINTLSMYTSIKITEFLMPWITILISLIIALMLKEVSSSIAKGLKFKMSKVFVPGDVVLLEGNEAIIIKVGLTTTVFESIRDEGLIWRYVPNEKIQSLKLEKVIRTDVRETNGA
tara:strand:- start:1177 stop:1524 length:348 start_codon:yes stop_codon:yes gene_type:complete